MKNETQNTTDFLSADISNVGKGKGGSKNAIEPDIYDAVCIGVCDAGKSVKSYQGKEKTVQNAVLVWQLDHVNGFGSQSIVTDWVVVSGHENSNFMKNFVVPTKMSIKSVGDIVGKSVRVEIDTNADGYPIITRYFTPKKALDIVDGLYIPAWIIKKGYPLRKHAKILDGMRPVTKTTEESTQTQSCVDMEKEAGDRLPF